MWTDKASKASRAARHARDPSAVPDRGRVEASGRGLATLGVTVWWAAEQGVEKGDSGLRLRIWTDVRGKEGAPPDRIESSGRGRIPSILVDARAK